MHDDEEIFDLSWCCLNETCLWLLEELAEEEEEVEVEEEVERKLDLSFLLGLTLMLMVDQKLRKVDFHSFAKHHNYVDWMGTLLVMVFAMNQAVVVWDDQYDQI